MENILQKVKDFVNQEINNKEENTEKNEFGKGYLIAMIDVRDYIDFREKENKMIGKYGYFWNDDNRTSCRYGKLDDLDDVGDYYLLIDKDCRTVFDNFSLTIPKHLK